MPLAGGEAVPVTRQPGVHSRLHDREREVFCGHIQRPHRARRRCRSALSAVRAARSGPRTHGMATIRCTPQFVDFRAEDGQLLRGVILLPPAGAATEVNGKVPLILNPYGGPARTDRCVTAAHTMDAFDQVLAHHGFAVLKVDNRGMGNRGRKFAMATFHHLGEVELRDNLAALDQALQRFPQLDSTRLGWWGWSYGGTMTAYALTHSDRFKAGISVAPVTDWHNYDTHLHRTLHGTAQGQRRSNTKRPAS